MLAIGDMFYLRSNSSLPTGWYIVKDMPYGTTYFGRVVVIINMTDGVTYRRHFGPLSNIQQRFSRSELGDLEVHEEGAYLLRRYFELMDVTEPKPINWITEGF